MDIPEEIWFMILGDPNIMEARHMCSSSRVCRMWRRIILCLTRVRVCSGALRASVLSLLPEVRWVHGKIVVQSPEELRMVSARIRGPLDLMYVESWNPEFSFAIFEEFTVLKTLRSRILGTLWNNTISPSSQDLIASFMRERVHTENTEIRVWLLSSDWKTQERYGYSPHFKRGTFSESVLLRAEREPRGEVARLLREVPLSALCLLYPGTSRLHPTLTTLIRRISQLRQVHDVAIAFESLWTVRSERTERYVFPPSSLLLLHCVSRIFPHLQAFTLHNALIRFSKIAAAPKLQKMEGLYVLMNSEYRKELQACLSFLPSLTELIILIPLNLHDEQDSTHVTPVTEEQLHAHISEHLTKREARRIIRDWEWTKTTYSYLILLPYIATR